VPALRNIYLYLSEIISIVSLNSNCGVCSPLQRLQCPIILPIYNGGPSINFRKHRVVLVSSQLRVHHVDGRQHALFAHRHSLIVKSWCVKGTLTDSVTHLHQVRLYRWNVVEFLQLDSVVNLRRLQKWVAFRMDHGNIVRQRCLSLE